MRALKRILKAAAMAGAFLVPLAAHAQQPIFYPAKGQSGQQQNRDQGECQVWAQQTTGINPANLPPPQAPQQTGPAVGGGERLRGAARGAVIGEIAGGHGGEGAAVGAMVGGARARRNQAAANQQAQQQAEAQYASRISTYNRAVGACMEGRGYTVR